MVGFFSKKCQYIEHEIRIKLPIVLSSKEQQADHY